MDKKQLPDNMLEWLVQRTIQNMGIDPETAKIKYQEEQDNDRL